MFKDRKDAGEHLARVLREYRGRDVLVLAIPRGGVRVGFEVARYLGAEFSLIVTRKLPYPTQPEAGFGAIAAEQRAEISRRIEVLRKGRPLPRIEGRTVILVDDGIAGGSTIRASIEMLKRSGAEHLVVAAPVAGEDRKTEIGNLVDDIVVLETPPFFRAVAQVYKNWYDVPDEEVLEIMEEWARLSPES
jgi:predicted phosphoribosyltransferase